jgi:hypothetical protein
VLINYGFTSQLEASWPYLSPEKLDRTEVTEELFGEEDIFEATDILGQSMQGAYKASQDWLENLPKEKEEQDT